MPVTKTIGNNGEEQAAAYLQAHGFSILDRNWRTRWCEIDIVAKKASTVYFVEVKYRYSDDYGQGYDVVTRKKIEQMTFAADFWAHASKYEGDMRLAVVSISGVRGNIEFIEVM